MWDRNRSLGVVLGFRTCKVTGDSPQVLLFFALFAMSLYFMCHISVGLNQELALPKVSDRSLGGAGGCPT